jgi:hypothetical protein
MEDVSLLHRLRLSIRSAFALSKNSQMNRI